MRGIRRLCEFARDVFRGWSWVGDEPAYEGPSRPDKHADLSIRDIGDRGMMLGKRCGDYL